MKYYPPHLSPKASALLTIILSLNSSGGLLGLSSGGYSVCLLQPIYFPSCVGECIYKFDMSSFRLCQDCLGTLDWHTWISLTTGEDSRVYKCAYIHSCWCI